VVIGITVPFTVMNSRNSPLAVVEIVSFSESTFNVELPPVVIRPYPRMKNCHSDDRI